MVQRVLIQKLRLFTGAFHANVTKTKVNNNILACLYGLIEPNTIIDSNTYMHFYV